MTPEQRKLSLKAYRLTQKNITGKELAKRLGLGADEALASVHAVRGCLIVQAEALQLSEREFLVMKTLARLEARRVSLSASLGHITSARIDRAAGKRAGWSRSVIDGRLGKSPDGGLQPDYFAFIHRQGEHVWLTQVGWAFAWETKLIKANWRVPA